MDEYKITTHSIEETLEIAQNIESEKFKNMVICLNGELGSGKTIFVKGFATGLGITEPITSPTFNIVKEYLDGEAPLYHMDVYRLEDSTDDIGISDYFKKGGVCIIEWAELIEKELPDKRLDIEFKIIDENTRVLKFIPHGKEYVDIVNSVI